MLAREGTMKLDSKDRPRYFDDDGNALNPELVIKPSLCLSCAKDDDPSEEIPCTLNRLDQQGEAEFRCGACEPMRPA
jgi:hypothetical protein